MTPTQDAMISLRKVCKSFAATQALQDAELDLHSGEVHAFVGENGAGKSTCLGVLAGRVAPTSGTIHVAGELLRCGEPRASRAAGIVAIYQELTIVPALTAQANVFLGLPLSRRGVLREREMRQRYEALCREVGVAAAPDGVPAGGLSVAEQQLLEILRALVADAKVILFDEPTASLARHERDAFLRLVDQLRSTGMTIVFVSHNLEEVLAISDTITVFRDGRITKAGPRSDWDKRSIVQEMLGDAGDSLRAQEILDEVDESDSVPLRGGGGLGQAPGGPPLLAVEGLTVPGAVEEISLEVRPGEIFGIGGLVGSGRSTILRTLAGLHPEARGRLWIDGRETPLPKSVPHARKLGIALLPEDRKRQGLVLQLDAMNNVALSDLGAVSRLGVISKRRLRRAAIEAGGGFGFNARRVADTAANLSGGNQQKLLLARLRFSQPRLLLADEPTRGIDIGAKAEIMASLRAMAAEGLAIIIVSSELEEVCELSERILVLSEGRAAGMLEAAAQPVTPHTIMSTAYDISAEADPPPVVAQS